MKSDAMLTFHRNRQEERHVNEPREEGWLPVLGPTAWILGRFLASELEHTDRITWRADLLSHRIGIGRNSGVLQKTLDRLKRYGVLTGVDDGAYVVRRGWGEAPRRGARPTETATH